MQIYEVQDRNKKLLTAIVNIWEESVRATHLFLSDSEINKIKANVPQALGEVKHLFVVENEFQEPIAFAGTNYRRLEMLFISPKERGKGIGKHLLQYVIKYYGIQVTTVNEQNPQAIGFYEHMGFIVYKRTEFDEDGNPYPLLYMKRIE